MPVPLPANPSFSKPWRSHLIPRQVLVAFSLVAIALLGLGAGAGAWVSYRQLTGNFHAVEPGIMYRSNTLGTAQLIQVIKDNHIKSIINLRGGSDAEDWYRSEGETAEALGVARFDIPLSDVEVPDSALLARLITALRTAPKPVLVHCKAGADRTGLASALYEYLVADKPANAAAGQLSFFYGHFPWYPSRTGAMDEAFWSVVQRRRPYLAYSGDVAGNSSSPGSPGIAPPP